MASGRATTSRIPASTIASRTTFCSPSRFPSRGTLYAGGESPAAKELIAEKCDAYLMHGDPPERVREKIRDLRERRAKHNLPAMKFGVAGYAIVRETEREAQ